MVGGFGRPFYMNIFEKIALIIDLATSVESEDPIDWGMLNVDERETYRLMAMSVVEQYPDADPSLLAVILKLVVENFVLHLKLMRRT